MFDELLKDPSKLGATIVLLAVVVGFMKEYIVTGASMERTLKTYTDGCREVIAERDAQIVRLLKERDEFKEMTLRSIEITERVQKVADGVDPKA